MYAVGANLRSRSGILQATMLAIGQKICYPFGKDSKVVYSMMDESKFKRLLGNRERVPDPMRYRKDAMQYRHAGKSGLKLPEISLGLWHNFGAMGDSLENMRDMIFTAFDNGITNFDIANNYGPPNGAAEENFGRILKSSFSSYRDEMLICTKAGFGMWKGPYGDGGSKKYLTAALDQSLKRLGVDYVDIFYHHRPDPNTPIEETCYALHRLVEAGKALYIGVSNYNTEQLKRVLPVFRELKTPFLLNQVCYNLLDRTIEENGMMKLAEESGFGIIVYSPLAQGLLTDKYRYGIPADSRMQKSFTLKQERLTPTLMKQLDELRDIAEARAQTLAELALSWVLRSKTVSSVIIGASSSEQILDNIRVNPSFSEDELAAIERICGQN